MEEKYPIKFSLGQFILLLGVEVVVLALVFLLGARFGSNIFPGLPAEQIAAKGAWQGLEPDAPRVKKKPVAKLTDVPEDEEVQAADPNGEGELIAAEEEAGEADEDAAPSRVGLNKSLLANPADKNTLIRFKSSNSTHFAIEVGKYFDEMLASRQVTKLKDKGYEAYLIIEGEPGGSSAYGVRVGSFAERKIAEEYATKMSNDQGIELRVVQVD